MLRATRLTAATAALALLAATAPADVARADVGDVKDFPLPFDMSIPGGITLTSSGDLWMSPSSGTEMVSMSPTGVASLHPLPVLVKPVTGRGIAQDTTGAISFVAYSHQELVTVDADGGNSRKTPVPDLKYGAMVAGTDGSLWIRATAQTSITRARPGGGYTQFPTPDVVGDLAAGPGYVVFSQITTPVIGKMAPDGTYTTVAVPKPVYYVAAEPNGTLWGARSGAIYKVAPSGAVTTTAVPTSIAGEVVIAPDGSAWYGGTRENGQAFVGRIRPDGTNSTILDSFSSLLTIGADGNLWFYVDRKIRRVLTGVVPAIVTPPAISGSGNSVGTKLSVTQGQWNYLPSSYAYQWQRCAANDSATCTPIPAATSANYTIADADLGGWLRSTVTAKNLNGTSKPAASTLFQVASKPTAPTQPTPPTNPTTPTTPTTPAPVTGIGRVTVAAGVIAALSGPSSAKRKAKRTYRLTFTAPEPRGTVKFSLVKPRGVQAYVIAAGANVHAARRGAQASRSARIPKSVSKGAYLLVAVYTPRATQASTYAVATITKPLTVR